MGLFTEHTDSIVRCRECKHWGDAAHSVEPVPPARICEKMTGYSQNHMDPGHEHYDPSRLAVVAFGYDLITLPDFYCAHGEKPMTHGCS